MNDKVAGANALIGTARAFTYAPTDTQDNHTEVVEYLQRESGFRFLTKDPDVWWEIYVEPGQTPTVGAKLYTYHTHIYTTQEIRGSLSTAPQNTVAADDYHDAGLYRVHALQAGKVIDDAYISVAAVADGWSETLHAKTDGFPWPRRAENGQEEIRWTIRRAAEGTTLPGTHTKTRSSTLSKTPPG